jgi:protein N-terminal asparagine amidohydrolase
MVIANSESTSTLVSVDNAVKRVPSLGALQVSENQEIAFRETDLCLPKDAFCLEDDDDEEQPIYLSAQGSNMGVDDCLRCMTQFLAARDKLLSQEPVNFTRFSKERILYVGQGEVAHAVPLQCDVIMSDKATTCHILAFRSATDEAPPLVSLAHLDGPNYDHCIRSMVQQHQGYHLTNNTSNKVQLSVHIMGGYEDSNGSSRSISNWLIHLLADIAEEERVWLRVTLLNCAITSMNDTGHGSPIGRGLALNVRTGKVFLARCDEDVAGPHSALRSARIWSRSATPKLSLIHYERSNNISVEPFLYSAFQGIDRLLSLSDDVLVKYTSTSADCEEDDFCTSLRSTLKMVRDVPYSRVFGDRGDRALTYKRAGRTNTWKPVGNCY